MTATTGTKVGVNVGETDFGTVNVIVELNVSVGLSVIVEVTVEGTVKVDVDVGEIVGVATKVISMLSTDRLHSLDTINVIFHRLGTSDRKIDGLSWSSVKLNTKNDEFVCTSASANKRPPVETLPFGSKHVFVGDNWQPSHR